MDSRPDPDQPSLVWEASTEASFVEGETDALEGKNEALEDGPEQESLSN